MTDLDEAVVERLAKHLYESKARPVRALQQRAPTEWEDQPAFTKDGWRDTARAAIRLLQREGWASPRDVKALLALIPEKPVTDDDLEWALEEARKHGLLKEKGND